MWPPELSTIGDQLDAAEEEVARIELVDGWGGVRVQVGQAIPEVGDPDKATGEALERLLELSGCNDLDVELEGARARDARHEGVADPLVDAGRAEILDGHADRDAVEAATDERGADDELVVDGGEGLGGEAADHARHYTVKT